MLESVADGRVLCFFAHPDDETLAAGATMSKLARLGAEVHVAIPATGVHARKNLESASRREQSLDELRADCGAALGVLGVSPSRIYLGEFADNELDRYSRLDLIHWLEELFPRVQPTLLLTHHRYCTNVDHQYCHEAAVVATRPSVTCQIRLIAGEVPSSTGYLRPANWEPNLYVDVSSEDVDRKIAAMETYKGETRPDPHPRSSEVLRALAKVRGSESGFQFAEAFMVQRTFG